MRPKTTRMTKVKSVIETLRVDEVAEGEDGREDAAAEVDDAGSHEVADAFDVGHDAGDEGSGAVLVVEGDGEAADVGLDLGAEFGDEALPSLREKLGKDEAADTLDDGGEDDDSDDLRQEREVVLRHDAIDEVLGRGGEDETACAVDDHDEEAAGEEPAAGLDELPDFGEDFIELGLGAGGGQLRRGGSAWATGWAIDGLHAGAEARGAVIVSHKA